MKHLFTNLLLILPVLTYGQVQENFSDGNFSTGPAWGGDIANFIVNTDSQLQLHGVLAATSYLSTPHNLSNLDQKEWNLYVKLSFAGSTSNYARIYLTANNANLGMNPDGYFLQLGEALTIDAIRLFKHESGADHEICSGTAGAIANAVNAGIKVVRDDSGNWSLYVDYAGGTNYVLQSTGSDASELTGTHSGMLCAYTASNATKFYFDNIYIGNEILDTEPPTLISVIATDGTHVDLLFSEPVLQSESETISNYSFNPVNAVISAERDLTDYALVHLSLQNLLPNGSSNQVTANVTDLSGNSAVQTGTFNFLVDEIPVKGDVIINEFMSDPSPALGLPEVEYVEIYNKSEKYFNLDGWKLGDNATNGTITDAWLFPGEHKVLCPTSGTTLFSNAVSITSFPSLNNSEDDIVLKNSNDLVLDKLTYNESWYRDEIKKEGGYSMELINPNDPCSDASNWIASNHQSGGTPGIQNSVHDISLDLESPQIIQVLAAEPNLLQVIFNEGLDSVSIANAACVFDPVLTISQVLLTEAFPTKIAYTFQENLVGSQLYHFTLNNLADCWLNNVNISSQFVLPELAQAGDLVINEILFNPVTAGSDFVEIRNNSGKMIDLFQMQLGNFDDDSIANLQQIPVHFILNTGELAVITPDSLVQLQQYPAAIPKKFIQMNLPALNNDSGTVFLIRDQTILDKVSYFENWHFKLLDDFDGKSLEKIDPAGNSNDGKNWHTAAEAIGFATPGKENSQYVPATQTGNLSLASETFSPDNDGNEDVLQINYLMDQPGMVGTVTIFDDRGRLVKNLAKSELLGQKGNISWDGMAENNQKAGIGTYVLVFEAFDISGGGIFTQKKAFVLAGKI